MHIQSFSKIYTIKSPSAIQSKTTCINVYVL